MSNQTFTREYLLSLPTEARKGFMKQYIQSYIQQIIGEARQGKTSSLILFPPETLKGAIAHHPSQPWQAPPTQEEVHDALQESFPDCKIVLEEKWVSIAPTKQELKKGILVEWS